MCSNLYIDIGSTNIKWQADGGGTESVSFPLPCRDQFPFYEVETVRILEIIQNLILQKKAKRVFFSVQMHGYVLAEKSGQELTNYISWKDCRAAFVNIPFTIDKKSGSAMKNNLPRAGVYASKVLGLIPKSGALEFFTLGSYLMYKLTGKNITHITDAAASGYYNAATCLPLLDDSILLPEATDQIVCAGKCGESEIYTPVGDQQAAILGCGASEEDYIINLGTAGQACCISQDNVVGEFESRPYFGHKTLCTVTGLMAGRANYDLENAWDDFYEQYKNALLKLPPKKKIIVTGGLIQYHRKEMDQVFDKIGVAYTYHMKADTLSGLKILAENISL